MIVVIPIEEIEKDCPPDQVKASLRAHEKTATWLGELTGAIKVEYKNYGDYGEEYILTHDFVKTKIACHGKSAFIKVSHTE